MQEEPFVAGKSIYETSIRGKDKPLFYGTKNDTLTIQVSFAFLDTFDSDKIRAVKRWLCGHDYYQPLYFSSDVNKIYYALPIQNSELIHNCLSQGYVDLTFRTNSPYAYSNFYITNEYTSVDNLELTVTNYGDVIIYPEFWITKDVDSNMEDITIKNASNGQLITFWNVHEGEEIYINTEQKYIESNFTETLRYDNMEGYFWGLEYGDNLIQLTGDCKIKFRYQCKFL